jgi:hypothetical protein
VSLDEGTLYRVAPVVSITRYAEADLTFPEGDSNKYFVNFKIIPPIYMVSHLYRLLPVILKSHSYKFGTLTYQFLHKVVALSGVNPIAVNKIYHTIS